VNSSEIDVRLTPHERPEPGVWPAVLRAVPGLHGLGVQRSGRPPAEVLADIRDRVGSIPGVTANVGQPISHRLDHIMSGVRAQVAVKVFGPDLLELRAAAQEVQDAMANVPGVVDLQVEPQVEISQVRLRVKRDEATRYGLAPGDVAGLLETAYKGRTVSAVLDGEKSFSLVVWYDAASRSDPAVIGQTILDTPSGRKVALSQVAEVLDTTGPNTLNHETSNGGWSCRATCRGGAWGTWSPTSGQPFAPFRSGCGRRAVSTASRRTASSAPNRRRTTGCSCSAPGPSSGCSCSCAGASGRGGRPSWCLA
jgi:Cu/Ag efflux pump CusA